MTEFNQGDKIKYVVHTKDYKCRTVISKEIAVLFFSLFY